jgi:DNA-binding beta-propeller fold protein YncE
MEAGSALVEPAAGEAPAVEREAVVGDPQTDPNFTNTFTLLLWWSIATLITLSYAGERMPWLTVHIAWPMIFLTGWAVGYLVDTLDWVALRRQRVLLTLVVVVIFIASVANAILSWNLNPPFQGKDLVQLQATGSFLLPGIAAIASAVALVYLLRAWTPPLIRRVFSLTIFGFLLVITARAAFRAAYINYDDATEFLVYAHGATPIKEVMAQAREISERTAGGLNIAIAYDASAPDTGVSWPFVWYLRDYTNQRSFDAPTRSLRDSVMVIVDAKNFDKIEPALGPNYYRIDYIRMWWPMQDYFAWVTPRDTSTPFDPNYSCKGLLGFFRLLRGSDYSRICTGLTDPAIRAGIVDIWWNRDYTKYAQALGRSDLTLASWQPSDQMRLYIRKDVVAQIWNYGVGPVASETVQDPTEGKLVQIAADLVIDGSQVQPAGLNSPRSLAFAPDGTLYVADSLNHRILHLDENGKLIKAWGSFAQSIDTAPAPPGTFNEPWGVAVGPDSSVYVTDTWNHRVQKFTATGSPLLQWGHFGQADTPDALYGPRGIAVDSNGHVYVADTGNKRIVVFDSQGNPITQIGSGGFEPGQFDEPVGVAVDAAGRLYVADTWNQRIQSFIPSADGLSFAPDMQWDVYGWFGQSLENKPFIAVDAMGHVFITDPEGYRVMEFSNTGELLRVWGDYGTSSSTFNLPSGIAVDPQGRVWVTDAGSHRILRFTVPQ